MRSFRSLPTAVLIVAASFAGAQSASGVGQAADASKSMPPAVKLPDWPAWALNLPEWLKSTYAHVALWQWLALLGLLLVALLVGYVVRQVAMVSLRSRYAFHGVEFSKSSKRGTRRAVAVIVATLIWWLAIPGLALPPDAEVFVFRIVNVITALAVVWLLASLWNAFCELLLHRSQSFDKRTERLLVPVTRKFVTAIILIGGLLGLLGVLGVNVVSIVAGLGIGGLAVALAAKDSVENVFGSLTILFDMPFALGDWVKIDKVEGVVEQINLRSTRIRTFEDSLITLPNSNLIKASVENFGARRYRRQMFTLKFSVSSDASGIEAFCKEYRKFVSSQQYVVADKTTVEFNEVTELWAGVLVICFLEMGVPSELAVRSKLMAGALRIAKDSGLKFASQPAAMPAGG